MKKIKQESDETEETLTPPSPQSPARRLWIIVPAILVAALIATLALNLGKPPFKFIDRLHGIKFDNDHFDLNDEDIMGPPQHHYIHYAFMADYQTVQAALEEELRTPDWVVTGKGSDAVGISSADDTKYVMLSMVEVQNPTIPNGTKCYLAIDAPPSWLDRQWQTIKGWFGGS